jgi:translocation and assembly module TamA
LTRLACAAATAALCASPALAGQDPWVDSAELDPSAPLDPMPDLGVDWPDPVNGAPDLVEPDRPADWAATITDTISERHYIIAIEGLQRIGNSAALVDAFEQQSALYEGRREEANAAQLARRSENDAELLAELLRSQGYYDAVVEPVVALDGQVLRVTLEADPGVQYRFHSVELPGLEAAGEDADALRRAFPIQAGDPVIAQDIIAAGLSLRAALGEQGFALAQVGEREIIVDHRTNLATLVLPVETGPVARFGRIRVSGEPPFSDGHVSTIARFDPGDRFERGQGRRSAPGAHRHRAGRSAQVEIVPVPGDGIVDLDVALTPAPTRTIAGELGYGTGEGAKLEASWQNRNFINPEGALTLRGIAGTREQLVGVQFRRSNFGARDRVFELHLAASNSRFDAFEARTIRFLASLERQSNIIWPKTLDLGDRAELLATDERGVFTDPSLKETRTFLISALPAHLAYDGSDDLLNPTRGFRAAIRLSPEISAKGGSFAYAKAQVDGSAYHPMVAGTVLAGRVRLGSIWGGRAVDRPVEAILRGRRRLGSRLRLPASRSARLRRRPGRRQDAHRIRHRGANSDYRFRQRNRDRSLPRRRIADQQGHSRTSTAGSSGRGWAFAIIRASVRSGLTSEPRSTRAQATAGSLSRCRSGRPSDGQAAVEERGSAAGHDTGSSRTGARLGQELLALVLGLLVLAAPVSSSSTRRPATAGSSTGSRQSKPIGSPSGSGESTARSSANRRSGTSPFSTSMASSSPRPRSSSTGGRSPGFETGSTFARLHADRATLIRLPEFKPTETDGRSFPAST